MADWCGGAGRVGVPERDRIAGLRAGGPREPRRIVGVGSEQVDAIPRRGGADDADAHDGVEFDGGVPHVAQIARPERPELGGDCCLGVPELARR